MGPIRRWRHLPRSYRILVVFFGVLDVAVLWIVASGLRSWLHAGEAVLLTAIFLMFLYPFYVPVPPDKFLLRRRRLAGFVRIAAGSALLFLSGWFLVDAAVAVPRGPLPEYFLEAIVFVTGLAAMGVLFVRSGRKRLHEGSIREDAPLTSTRAAVEAPRPGSTPGEKMQTIASLIAFFILGSAVLYSFDFYTGAIAFQPSGWFTIPAGIAIATAILVGNRKLMRKARICLQCGQRVPHGAMACPSCGRPFG